MYVVSAAKFEEDRLQESGEALASVLEDEEMSKEV